MKKEIYIYHLKLSQVTDKNGVVKQLTEIDYLSDKADNENSFGQYPKKCYKMGNFFNDLKKYVMQKVVADFEIEQTDNGEKHKIIAINNVQLQSK